MISTLLDIRRIIAGLLGVYGVILLVAGIVLLLMATFFLVWALTRPLMDELDEAEAEGERPETAPPEEPR